MDMLRGQMWYGDAYKGWAYPSDEEKAEAERKLASLKEQIAAEEQRIAGILADHDLELDDGGDDGPSRVESSTLVWLEKQQAEWSAKKHGHPILDGEPNGWIEKLRASTSCQSSSPCSAS